MNAEERTLIAGLFERLRSSQTGYRDPEADAFIAEQVARQPHAPYALAQTVIVQNQAIAAAHGKIVELERSLTVAQDAARDGAPPSPDSGSPSPWGPRAHDALGAPRGLSAPRGMGASQAVPGQQAMGAPQGFGNAGNAVGRQGDDAAQPPQGGDRGGFLAGALQTAAGVAGGALLFSGIQSLFSGGAPEAAKTPDAPVAEAEKPDAAETPDQAAAAQPDAADAAEPEAENGGWFSGLMGDSGGDEGGGDWA